MPIIRIDYDNDKVKDEEIVKLSEFLQPLVAEKTDIAEVMVYANYPHIKYKIFPIEVFIEMPANKIEDRQKLVKSIRSEIESWKEKSGFSHLINLTLIPMDWDMEFDI